MSHATIKQLLADGTITMETEVLGTLPMTADGFIAGLGSRMYYTHADGKVYGVGVLPERTDDCYSTREAAERAAEGAK